MALDTFRQDVRIGLRVLRKDKTFFLLAVLVLGLGIGGATTQFTVVNAVALRGLSFPHPEQLVTIGLIDPKATDQNNNFGFGVIPTAQDYEDLKASQQSCSLMAGYLSGSTINVTYKNNPQRYTGGYVTEDFFKIIGVSPIFGREFTAADNKPGAERTIILGYEIWKRDFNGDPNVVGQNVRANSKPATIIGVMPQNFKFPNFEELWTPLYNQFPPIPRGQLVIGANNAAPSVMGRLKPGVTLDQANAEFINVARQLAREYPKTNQNFTSATVQPLANSLIGVQFRQTVWAMLAAVILVLLIACVNVMNMQFGRAALRAKELAIRGALGATRWRLVRQMLTESLVVAIFGAVAGVLLAYWSVDLLTRAMEGLPSGAGLPYWVRFTIDARVLAFIVGITFVTTIVSGLVPALISAHSNAAEMMKEGGRGNSSRLVNVITRLLVIGQIALTAVLLIAATLEIRSIRNQLQLDYGYDENAIYSARMALMEGAYTEDGRREFFKRAVPLFGKWNEANQSVNEEVAAENIEAAVDYLREKRNAKVGSIHLNVFRPFPEAAVIRALAGKRNVIVLERTDEPMSGDNPMGREIRTSLSKALVTQDHKAEAGFPAITPDCLPRLFAGIYGLGSRDFRPEHVLGAYEFATGTRTRKDGKGVADGEAVQTDVGHDQTRRGPGGAGGGSGPRASHAPTAPPCTSNGRGAPSARCTSPANAADAR
jgi:predicted permease